MKRNAFYADPRGGGQRGLARVRATTLTTIAFVVVELICSAPARAQAPVWPLELDLFVAESQAPALVTTHAMVVDSALNMYVAQGDHVLVVSAVGRYVRAIGRRGAGPGEFNAIGALGWLGDTLWVTDERQNRVSYFNREGILVREASVRSPGRTGGLIGGGPTAVLSSGKILERYEGSNPEERHTVVPIVLHDLEAGTSSAIANYRVGDFRLVIQGDGWRMVTGHPLTDTDLLAVAPDGSAFAVLDRSSEAAAEGLIHATVYGPNGERIREIVVPGPARLLDDELRGRYAGPIYQIVATRHNLTLAAAKRIVDRAMDLPDLAPPGRRLLFSRSAELWIERFSTRGDVHEWWVIDRDGTLVGNVITPLGFSLLEADDTYVWGILLAESGLPELRRYRVER